LTESGQSSLYWIVEATVALTNQIKKRKKMKNTKLAIKLQNELNSAACRVMPIMEIPVKSIATGETDWITAQISFAGRSCIARREAVSKGEKRSKYVASSRILLDESFDLDSHLEAIYEEVVNDIINGGFYVIID